MRKIHLYSNLQRHTGNQNILEVDGETVGECLANLVGRYPSLRHELFDSSGQLTPQVFISINLTSANPEKVEARLQADDQLYVVIIVAGG